MTTASARCVVVVLYVTVAPLWVSLVGSASDLSQCDPSSMLRQLLDGLCMEAVLGNIFITGIRALEMHKKTRYICVIFIFQCSSLSRMRFKPLSCKV